MRPEGHQDSLFREVAMAQSQDLHEQEMKEAAAKGQASPASMANQDTAVSGTK